MSASATRSSATSGSRWRASCKARQASIARSVMPKDFPRTWRIGDQLQRELSELIRVDVREPRDGMVTVSAVKVTRYLAHAKVLFAEIGGKTDHTTSTLETLK